jgi:hypothetical protein
LFDHIDLRGAVSASFASFASADTAFGTVAALRVDDGRLVERGEAPPETPACAAHRSSPKVTAR